jgi:hypothetical protein
VVIEVESANAMKHLARAMALMPNLHTIQIICMKDRSNVIEPGHFRKAFAGRVYPSVRHAVLPIQARGMFPCLPALADVYINQLDVDKGFAEFASDLALDCHEVESFGWVVYDSQLIATGTMLFILLCP